MEDHETRRKIIREWMALPKEKRQTEEQVAAFAKKAVQQNEFHRSRRDGTGCRSRVGHSVFVAGDTFASSGFSGSALKE
jgi:hypothetical protein